MGKGGREVQRNPQKGQVVPSAMRAPALRRGRLGRGAAAAGEPRAGRGAEGDCQGPWASARSSWQDTALYPQNRDK